MILWAAVAGDATLAGRPGRSDPPPHFHARYGELKAIIDIESLTVLYGELTPRVLGLVVEWAALHRAELLTDWELARKQEPLVPIAPSE